MFNQAILNGSATVAHRRAAELPPSVGGDGTSAVRRSPAVRGLPAGHMGSSAGQMVMLAGNMVILLGKNGTKTWNLQNVTRKNVAIHGFS